MKKPKKMLLWPTATVGVEVANSEVFCSIVTYFFFRYNDKDWRETREREIGDEDGAKKETDRYTHENAHKDRQNER